LNVHFKEHKSPVGLSGKWALPIGNHHIDCYVWVNKNGILENVAHEDEDYDACYVHNPSRKIVGGLFGEVHIIETAVEPGNVAHELEHALLDWIQAHYDVPVISRVAEQLCVIMENMTRTYWEEYSKIFLAEEPEKEAENPVLSDVENSVETEQLPQPASKSRAGKAKS
jgi:hypothetical protein